VKVDRAVEALPRIGRDTPALAVKLTLGTEKLVVVAAHLAANQKVYLPEQPEGPTGRRDVLRAIVKFVDAERGAVVLLGDPNVREEEVPELLEMGRWRDAPYHGRSFGPRVWACERGSYGFGSGHRFDRIWFRGAVWTQCFMACTARRYQRVVVTVCQITLLFTVCSMCTAVIAELVW
jgi:hypothetical protein